MSTGLSGLSINLVETVDEAAAFLRWAGERPAGGVVSCDTETTGLSLQRDSIRLIQFGDSRSAWCIPFVGWSGVAEQFLRQYKGRLVFHNSPFDVPFINKAMPGAISWSQVEDTMPLAWLRDPLKPVALKKLSDRYIDKRASKMQTALDEGMSRNKWNWATVPVTFEPYWQYAGLDTILTAQLFDILQPSDSGIRDAYDLEMGVLPVFCAMMAKGFAVDTAFAAEKRAEFAVVIKQWKDWAASNYNGLMLTSNQQFVAQMQRLGVVLSKLTPGGSVSADSEVVSELLLHPSAEVRQLAYGRQQLLKLTKLSSSYLTGIIERNIDGRIHSQIRPLAAKTSRVSVTGALALQTLPRPDAANPEAIAIRKCFVPTEGNLLAMVDLEQIELRFAAHLSKDARMLEVLNNPEAEAFTEFSRQIYRDPSIQKSDPRRALTKSGTYALLYGAGAGKFSRTMGVTEAEGTTFVNGFFQTFSGLKAFQNKVQAVAKERAGREGSAYVRTPFGHKLYLDEPNETYKLTNFLIQGMSAGYMKQALTAMDNSGILDYLVMTIHDEVVLDAPKDVIEDATRVAKECLENLTDYSVPILAAASGPYERWGDKG